MTSQKDLYDTAGTSSFSGIYLKTKYKDQSLSMV